MGKKAESTRRLIREEAYRLFAEKGFKEVTMTDVCEKTGLSRGGLYRHYSSTSEIFSEILSQEYAIDGRMEKKESAEDILKEMLDAIKHEIMDKELSLSLAIYEFANLGHEDFFIRMNENAKKRWMSLINYGMEKGEFKKVDGERVTDLILYYYQGLRMWSRVIPFEQDIAEHYAETVRELLLKNR